MSGTGRDRADSRAVSKYAAIMAAGWTLLIAAITLWIVRDEMQDARELVRNEARAHFLKDQAFRLWGASHGGVYVPPTDHTPPNPNLSHIPDRDIVTTDGKKLTLMNPASMVRQLMEDYEEQYGIKGRITSLKPLRIENAPDEWERAALESFERGETEVNEFSDINGEPYLRLMKPLAVKQTCLKCHEHQGYKVGDVRGGIGVSVPAEPFFAEARQELVEHAIGLGLVWLLGIAALVFGARHIRRRVRERDRAEEELRSSEERFRNLAEMLPEAVFEADMNFDLTFANRCAFELFGYSDEDLKRGLNGLDMIAPEDRDRAKGNVAMRLKGEDPRTVEYQALKKDGSTFPSLFHTGPIMKDGKLVGIRGIIVDMAGRKRAEEELRDSLQMSDDLLRAIPSGIFIYDFVEPDKMFLVDANKQAEELTGIKLCDWKGKEFNEIWPQARGLGITDTYLNVARTGEIYEAEDLSYKDERLSAAFRVRTFTLPNHRLASAFEDITERKLAEEANVRLSSAIEQAGETVVITDAEGNIQYVNPAFEKITGYSSDEVIGQNPRFLKSDQHDDAFYKEMWETLSSGAEWHGEIVNKKKNGALFTESVAISPVFDTQGKVVNYVAVKNDITETKRLQELEFRAQRLETAGTIAGQVAHDFNNLLAPIMAYPEFIHEELPHDHTAHAYLDAIEDAAQKMAEINQDLLTMGRRGHYNLVVIDLNRIVLQAAQEMESRTKTVTVQLELCKDLMKIKGGVAQIHRMLSNLLVNAQDAMDDIGQITIKTEKYYSDDTSLAFGRVPKGEYVKLTISDSGCGIPDDIQKKILDPFFSTKTTNKKRGSGLGLSVVDAVMKDHGGYLDLSSKVGYGTSFYLYFPVTSDAIGDVASDDVAGGDETVLIVDDDDIQREVSSQLLTKLGYKVSAVVSGEKAIKFLRHNPQDLVILDMVIPDGIDGAETYRRMLEISPSQKAIILSGFSESDRVFEAQRLGTGAFVRKPVTKNILAAAVRTELDRTRVVAIS